MGFLKNIVSGAISNAVSKGIGDAVKNAVEKTVAPVAEEIARKGAEAVSLASSQMEKDIREASENLQEASLDVEASTASNENVSALEDALKHLESMARNMSDNMKVCLECGEPSSLDKEFCPYCGAKLPSMTLRNAHTCKECGKENIPGTKYCSGCGAKLPGAVEEENRIKEKDGQVLEEMADKLPEYPLWTVGGSELDLERVDDTNGYPCYLLHLKGGYAQLHAYIDLARNAGFKQYGQEYWKDVDGRSCTISCVDAVTDDTVTIGFYVSDYGKMVEEQPHSSSEDLDEIKDAAKGLLRKLFS